MKNSDKIILDLCGGTRAWSNPHKDAGYDVRVVQLPKKSVYFFNPPDKVYGMLAAPPCTYFSFARRKNMIKETRTFEKGLITVNACMVIIEKCIIAGGVKFWALENPRGFLRWFMGNPPFSFDPCDFGDPWTKRTDVWGLFNIPKLSPVTPNNGKFSAARTPLNVPLGYKTPPDMRDIRACRRSITPPGFAQAFFRANR